MTEGAKFTFRIEGMTPDDLPMRRLATYLEEFAKLLGEEPSLRFDGVYPGSACLAARVLPLAVPKVRERLAAIRDDASGDVHRQFARIDDLLAADNASGSISEDGHTGAVIRFPGAKERGASVPVVTEAGTLQGELVRIGGRDDTAHATLRDGDRFYTCVVTKDIARSLGKHLFGSPLRLHGRGRWRRTPDGIWELLPDGFRASSFEVVDPLSLQDVAEKLQAVGGLGLPDDDEKLWREMTGSRGGA